MKTSGSNWMKQAKDVLADSSQNTPTGNRKDKLEDILNDLMSLDGLPPLGPKRDDEDKVESASQQHSKNSSFQTPSSQGLRVPEHWKVISKNLNLPSSPEAIFKYFKNFHQSNRHKPLLQPPCGRVLYIEYDVEMERIRIFVGKQNQYVCIPRGIRELSGMLVVEEVYEFRIESRTRDMLSFKRVENTTHERHRLGRDLLNPREVGKSPVLHFTIFNDKGTGISSCSIKAESL